VITAASPQAREVSGGIVTSFAPGIAGQQFFGGIFQFP